MNRRWKTEKHHISSLKCIPIFFFVFVEYICFQLIFISIYVHVCVCVYIYIYSYYIYIYIRFIAFLCVQVQIGSPVCEHINKIMDTRMFITPLNINISLYINIQWYTLTCIWIHTHKITIRICTTLSHMHIYIKDIFNYANICRFIYRNTQIVCVCVCVTLIIYSPVGSGYRIHNCISAEG